jgi:hypothetical protein
MSYLSGIGRNRLPHRKHRICFGGAGGSACDARSFHSFQALFVFVFALPVWGQGIHAGLKLGVPLTQYFETGVLGALHEDAEYSAATRRYTFGASGEWRLTHAFGFEVDALYHRMGYVGIVSLFDSVNGNLRTSAIDVKGDSWDFPVMAKYRFGRVVRPYVAGGGVLRYVGPVRGRGELTIGSLVTRTGTTSPVDTTDPSDLRKRFYPGLTVASGIEIGGGRLRVLPEFRYTRWTANISGPSGVLRFAPNQVEFIVGVLF